MKTSSPVERWMKPYPFAPLNHLTVPLSLTTTPFNICTELGGRPCCTKLRKTKKARLSVVQRSWRGLPNPVPDFLTQLALLQHRTSTLTHRAKSDPMSTASYF